MKPLICSPWLRKCAKMGMTIHAGVTISFNTRIKDFGMFIIDFEASSLRKSSHPIEVAWGDSRENIKSFLLNPDYMADWTDWNPKSFEFHGITQEKLRREGVDPRKVARKMVDELAGQEVYSDEPRYDNRWKNRLLADSGWDPSLVRILDLNHYLNRMLKSASSCKTIVDYACTCDCRETRSHRAGADVYWLFELVEYVRQRCD